LLGSEAGERQSRGFAYRFAQLCVFDARQSRFELRGEGLAWMRRAAFAGRLAGELGPNAKADALDVHTRGLEHARDLACE
jgi:hypothetical protein